MIYWVDQYGDTGYLANTEKVDERLRALAKNHFAEFQECEDFSICAVDFEKQISTIYLYKINRTETISCTVY